MATSSPRYALTIVGGATAGAEAAALLGPQRMSLEGGRVVPGPVEDVHEPLVVSSIGSVPEPTRGVEQEGRLYRWTAPDLGGLLGHD